MAEASGMRRRSLLLVTTAAALAAAAAAGAAGAGSVPGATTIRACAGAGQFWPTESLAVRGTTAWVACKEEGRLVRVDLGRRRVAASVRLDGTPIAVTSGLDAVWALDTGSTLYRIAPATGKVTRRFELGAGAPYNLWIGGGSVWSVDDASGDLLRVSPASGTVVRIAVGDGPADLVFARGQAWVVNHRDRGLVRVDLATNRPTRLATLSAEVPERLALLDGSLWITGRGTDLLRVDPATGDEQATVEIGASGIDVVALGGALWVPVRSAEVDPTGLPTMLALRRIDAASRAVTTVARAGGRVDVHGLLAAGGHVWLADNRSGFLYRLR
jgi:streptogramin lyase